jgi:hypothetical protein
MNTDARCPRQRTAIALVTFYAIGVFLAVAAIVQAIRQESWGPIYTTGRLPAVVLASSGRVSARRCRPPSWRRAQREE